MTVSITFRSIVLTAVWDSPVLAKLTEGNERGVIVGLGIVPFVIAVVTVLALCCLRSKRGLRL
jgi:hypothetical protein